jgi:dihydroxyacetone kinase
MSHIYEDPATFKDDMINGFTAAYSRYVQRVPGAAGVMRTGGARKGKVSLIVGGGSGHWPAFGGVVGPGVADGAVIGDVFTSPSMEQAYRVAKALDGGAGVLFSFGNYAGDTMNFGAAEHRLRGEGIDCRTVKVTDDIASAPVDERHKRRGIAGNFPVYKIAGAAADRGGSLDEVERVARLCNSRTFTFGVAFAGCTLPGADKPLFTVADGQMDLGLGIHGEPGIRSVPRQRASELAQTLLEPLLQERPESTERAVVLVNGLGATKAEEMLVLYGHLLPALESAGVVPVLPEVAELVTSLDMAACSLTLVWLDEELEDLWSAPADTPTFRRGDVSVFPGFEAIGAAATVDEEAEHVEASKDSIRAAKTAREALRAMLRVVTENEDELGRIDAVAGDGDHGTGMTRGLRGATEAADSAADDLGASSLLDVAGKAWADKAGGTSGVLWGCFLQAIGRGLGNTGTPTPAALAAGIRDGADMMQHLGGAQLGDKTMLDTLFPFADELDEQLEGGASAADAWSAAASTAKQAAEDTTRMVPKVGRARPLAERSVGTPDAGATSMSLCVDALTPIIGRDCTGGAQS